MVPKRGDAAMHFRRLAERVAASAKLVAIVRAKDRPG